MIRSILLAFALSASASAAAAQAFPTDSLAALDPAKEVDAALARGDRRPLAVCGLACLAPGLDPAVVRRLPTARIIDGRGDVIHGE